MVIQNGTTAWRRLRLACELAKKELSISQLTAIDISGLVRNQARVLVCCKEVKTAPLVVCCQHATHYDAILCQAETSPLCSLCIGHVPQDSPE